MAFGVQYCKMCGVTDVKNNSQNPKSCCDRGVETQRNVWKAPEKRKNIH